MRRSRYYLIGFIPIIIIITPFIWSWIAGILRREAQFRDSERLLNEAVAEIDQADPHWRWADLIARKSDLPDDENLFVQVQKVKGWLNSGFQKHPSGNGYLFDEVKVEQNQLHDADDIAALGQHQAKFAQALALARKLENYSKGFLPFPPNANAVDINLTHTLTIREIAVLLKFEIEWLASNNRPKEAIPLLRSMLVASQLPGEESFQIGSLVRNASWSMIAKNGERLLGLTEPGPDLRTLLEPLRRATTGDAFYRAMRGERSFSDGMFCRLEENPENLKKLLGDLNVVFRPKDEITPSTLREYEAWIKADHASMIHLQTALLNTFHLPLHERVKAIRKIEIEWPKLKINLDRILDFGLDSPSTRTERMVVAEQRAVAQLESLRLAIACELFRIQEKRWPQTLAEIPKDLLPEIPADPFDGMPMRYRILPNGVAIWSVGETFCEDPLNLKEGEEKPRVNMVFRVWNPDKRRIAAPPPRPELLHDPMELEDEEPKGKE